MKVTFFMAALSLAASAFAQSKTETEVLALSKQRVEWLLKGNTDALANLYDTASITVHGNGMVKSAAEHMADVKSGRPTYKSIDYKEATVKDFGNTAVLVGKGTFSISINGQDMTQNVAFTEVYMKRDNQWKLIARHTSQIQ